jgi:hypothetical protein
MEVPLTAFVFNLKAVTALVRDPLVAALNAFHGSRLRLVDEHHRVVEMQPGFTCFSLNQLIIKGARNAQ